MIATSARWKTLFGCIALVALSACTNPKTPPADGIFDPYEARNRKVHAFNRGLDKAILRPASQGYVKIIPEAAKTGVVNLADNWNTPNTVVNNVLQGRLGKATKNTIRFAFNTIVGLGGLFDPASEAGLVADDTDFGETLATWGVKEGAYVEMPAFGPSTERGAAGLIVDLVMNPLSSVLPKKMKRIGTYANFGKRLGDRGKYGDTIDSILYDSADSYAQTRLMYLQNRRFDLKRKAGQTDTPAYEDAYEDPYE